MPERAIKLKKGSTPVFVQPYRDGPKQHDVFEMEVKKMLNAEVIEEASWEWASPEVLTPKHDCLLRVFVGYSKLNAIPVKDTYPLPRMEDCINSLADAEFFTTLDDNSGYWHVPIRESVVDKTIFTCHQGSDCFLRMTFGLKTPPRHIPMNTWHKFVWAQKEGMPHLSRRHHHLFLVSQIPP